MSRRGFGILRLLIIVGALVMFGFLAVSDSTSAPRRGVSTSQPELGRPALGQNPYGAVVITTEISMCTGIPVKDTNIVVTVAHCLSVGTEMYRVTPYATVAHGDSTANGIAVRIPATWLDGRGMVADVGLVYTDIIWGHGVDGFSASPHVEQFTAYGRQNFNERGVIVRGEHAVQSGIAECVFDRDDIDWEPDGSFHAPCGMIAGASGGPVVGMDGNSPRLVGVISTSTRNGRNGFTGHQEISDLLAGHGALHIPLEMAATTTTTSLVP